MNIISTTDISSYAPDLDTSRYTDVTLSGVVSQASKMVSDYLLFDPVAEDITDEVKEAYVTSDGDLLIYPTKIPVITVSAIKINKGATTITLNLTDGAGTVKYNVDYNKRYIRYPFGEIDMVGYPVFTDFYSLRGTQFYVKLTYRGGFEAYAMPESIRQATLLYVRELLSRQYNTTGAERITQGGITLQYSSRGSSKSDLVSDAERLLAPYRRIG